MIDETLQRSIRFNVQKKLMKGSIKKLLRAGASLDGKEDFATGDRTYSCRVKEKLVSSLVLTQEDIIAPDFGNEKIKVWAEGLLTEIERIANEQAEGE